MIADHQSACFGCCPDGGIHSVSAGIHALAVSTFAIVGPHIHVSRIPCSLAKPCARGSLHNSCFTLRQTGLQYSSQNNAHDRSGRSDHCEALISMRKLLPPSFQLCWEADGAVSQGGHRRPCAVPADQTRVWSCPSEGRYPGQRTHVRCPRRQTRVCRLPHWVFSGVLTYVLRLADSTTSCN